MWWRCLRFLNGGRRWSLGVMSYVKSQGASCVPGNWETAMVYVYFLYLPAVLLRGGIFAYWMRCRLNIKIASYFYDRGVLWRTNLGGCWYAESRDMTVSG